MTTEVDLGFAEKSDDRFETTSLFYPSKLGGRPAWLCWNDLPQGNDLKCQCCQKQLIFLCQLYVPVDCKGETTDNNNEFIHKMLYLFCCLNGSCYKKKGKCVRVYRSLKTGTDNYSEEDLKHKSEKELDILLQKLISSQPLCKACGCYGDKKCSRCHKVTYCSKEHQIHDWKIGGHKKECNRQENEQPHILKEGSLLFNEYNIAIEAEPISSSVDIASEKKKYEEYLHRDARKVGGKIDKNLEEEFQKVTTHSVDETFMEFKERISREPEQIIRYEVGGNALWVSSENTPQSHDIPKCNCGSERQFEFQVLPQMLNYLGIETTIESLDWGTLCIYTCKENCNTKAYNEEFLWQQDFSSTDNI